MNVLANIKSAAKRILVSEKKTAVNKVKKSAIKTYIKKFDSALENNNIDEAKELLKITDKALKKASYENIIHKNAASRKISQLTKKLNNKINEAA